MFDFVLVDVCDWIDCVVLLFGVFDIVWLVEWLLVMLLVFVWLFVLFGIDDVCWL